MNARTFRPDIQGLRGIAVVAVVAYHLGIFFPGGFLGVDIFFVISGFVIGQILLHEWESHGHVRWAKFFARRFFRLIPALALVVLVTMALAVFVFTSPAIQENAVLTGVSALLGVSNFVIADLSGGYFGFAPAINPLIHTWSLSVEWQFYLIFPLLLLALGAGNRKSKPPREGLLLVTLLLISALSFALSFGEARVPGLGEMDVLGFYSPLPRMWEFGLGILALLVVRRLGALSRAAGSTLAGVGLLAITFSLFFVSEDNSTPGVTTLIPTVGTALLIVAGSRMVEGEKSLNGALSIKPLRWLGDLSYSLYLWHWPVLYFAKEFGFPNNPQRMVAVVGLSLLASVISYYWVETKFRSRQWPVSSRVSVRAVALGVTPFLVAGLWPIAGDTYRNTLEQQGVIDTVPGDVGHDLFHETVEERFFPCLPPAIRDEADRWKGFLRCQQSKETEGLSVALVGDSHAEHLFAGLATALPEENVGYYIRSGELAVAGSSAQMRNILHTVAESESIHTVVISNWWMLFGVPVDELATTVATLEDAGKRVIITNDIPTAPFNADNCKTSAYIFAPRECDFPVKAIEFSREEVQKDLEAVVKKSQSAYLMDTYGLFCEGDFCTMDVPEYGVVYRDNDHLNLLGSELVAIQIAEKIGHSIR